MKAQPLSSGIALALVGFALVILVTWALYTRESIGLVALVSLGMPLVLLTSSFGIVLVGLGVWLAGFWHPAHRA